MSLLPISASDTVEVAGITARVPDARTVASVKRDLLSEGISVRRLSHVLSILSDGRLPVDDHEFVTTLIGVSNIPTDQWVRLMDIAFSVPETAIIVADWQYEEEIRRAHTLRWHVLLSDYPDTDAAGRPVPLPMKALNGLTGEQKVEVYNKIQEMMEPNTRP